VTAVADVDADPPSARIEDGVSLVPGGEVEFLPEPRGAVRDVVLAVATELLPVLVDDRSGGRRRSTTRGRARRARTGPGRLYSQQLQASQG